MKANLCLSLFLSFVFFSNLATAIEMEEVFALCERSPVECHRFCRQTGARGINVHIDPNYCNPEGYLPWACHCRFEIEEPVIPPPPEIVRRLYP